MNSHTSVQQVTFDEVQLSCMFGVGGEIICPIRHFISFLYSAQCKFVCLRDSVVTVKSIPALHHSVDIIFWSFGINFGDLQIFEDHL